MVAVASKLSTHTASSLAAQCYIKLDGVMKLIGCDIVPGLPTLMLMKEAATDRIKHTVTITLLLSDVHWTSAQTYRNLQFIPKCQFTLACKEDLFRAPYTNRKLLSWFRTACSLRVYTQVSSCAFGFVWVFFLVLQEPDSICLYAFAGNLITFHF